MSSIPTFQSLCIEVPLYAEFSLGKLHKLLLHQLMSSVFSLDCYCTQCGIDSVFLSQKEEWRLEDTWHERIFRREFCCSRNAKHRIYFIFRLREMTLTKIGQSPSLADIAEASLRKYKGVLDSEQFRELSRAVGLASHGVGIGAFVYLRRIFERLIEEAHQKEKTGAGWNEADYLQLRVDERINALKATLPAFLVEQRSLYGILSKGIHELSEKECIDTFPTVRVGIELILDQKVALREQEQKMKNAKQQIQALRQKLSNV